MSNDDYVYDEESGEWLPASELADLTVAKLEPMAKEMRRLLADPAEIDRILKSGAQKARAIATPVMDEVKKRVGFIA